MAFKIEGKEMYPIFVLANVLGQFTTKWLTFGKHAHSKQRNHSHTNSAVSRQVYVDALLVKHLQSAFFQYMIW